MKSFLTNQKIQLVLNEHNNKERKIETSILQELPMLLIFFLIYISGVFDAIREINLTVIFLSFVDDLGLIAFGASVKEISQTLSKVIFTVLH